MAVPLQSINDLLSLILDEFEQSGYDDFEQFSRERLNKFSTDFLAVWFLAKLYSKKRVALKPTGEKSDPIHTRIEERQIIESNFPEAELWRDDEHPFHRGIQYLTQKLWSRRENSS